MNRLRYFTTGDILRAAANEKIEFAPLEHYEFDDVNQPLHCTIDRDEKVIIFRIFSRSTLGFSEDNPACTIHFSPDGKKVRDKKKSPYADLARFFLKAAVYLRRYIAEHDLTEAFADMDTEMEGIIVRFDEENVLHLTRVSGAQRPDLACTALFGNIEMGRPYEDELEALEAEENEEETASDEESSS